MAAPGLDIDDILRAQSSDEELDEDGAQGERILDADALDRRLEEILNAEEEEEDDNEGADNSSSANPPSRSELEDDLSWRYENSMSYSSIQDTMPSGNYGDEDSSSAPKESSGLLQSENHKDDKIPSELTPDSPVSSQLKTYNGDARNLGALYEGIAKNVSQLQKDAQVSDSLHSSSALMASNAEEELSSRMSPSPIMQVPSMQIRETRGFSQGMDYALSSVAILDKTTSATVRPGFPLKAAAAASVEATSPLLSNSTPKRLSVRHELGQDKEFSRNNRLVDPTIEVGPSEYQITDGRSTSVESVWSSTSLGTLMNDDLEQFAHTKPIYFTSNEEILESTQQAESVESEDDTSLLDDEEEDAFDIESALMGNPIIVTSDDDSEEEELKSVLSRELSETKVPLPLHKSDRENTSSEVVRPEGNFTEPQISALDRAEEAEKKASLSGFGIEEGAASQPMRLKGIQTGPPNIQYIHIDILDSVSQILTLVSTTREHGTAQAITMHSNYLAVGLSKGSVFLLSLKSNGGKFADAVDKPLLLSSPDKSHASVTSLSFNMQGDLLLVGYANGFLALWELSSKGGFSRTNSVEHTAAILHTAFLCTKYQKAITADCKGLILLHTISWSTFGRYSITSQCLVDGQKTGLVLCVSPLLLEIGVENSGQSTNTLQPTTAASAALTSMVGGMVRGVVAGKADHGKRSIHEGGTADEAGNMVVFVTHQSIIVFRLPPMLEKCAMLPRPDGIRDGGIPYIAWRPLRIKSGATARSSGHSRNQTSQAEPIADVNQQPNKEETLTLLVLGWDRKVFVLQMLKGEMKIAASWDVDTVICGVAWLDEQIVAIVTLKEQLCLFTIEGHEVHRVAVESDETKKSLELSYQTHLLNAFGNPEKTYFSSLTARAATMYLLGPQRIYRAQLLPWQDQLRALQDAGDWMGAFYYGMELFDGRAVAVMGLPKGIDALRKTVTATLLNLLSDYIDEVFTYLALAFETPVEAAATALEKEELKAQAKEQYARVGGVAIEFCVHISQTDVLFDHVFHKFCAAGQRGTFLELLEPYILKDTLGALAPEVMQGLVEYYRQMGWLQRVELCILHMDIASLDFNQVVRLCRENGLYSALIYLFNKGLDDYKSPLEELLVVVQDISNSLVQACGYKLLIYLKYCFLGLAFPPGHGQIATTRLPALRSELLQCLLDDKPLVSQNDEKQPDMQIIIHPRLSCLLTFDLSATLEVLRYAFPMTGPLAIGRDFLNEGLPGTDIGESELYGVGKDGLQLLQDIVGALTDILEWIHLHTANGGGKSHVELDAWRLCMSKIDAGQIMEFIADFVASRHAKVSRVVLARILEYLTSADRKTKAGDAKRKESLLVKILNGVPESEWDPAHVLELALQVNYWQASACLLAKEDNLVAALDSYLKDKEQPFNAFLFILDVLSPEKQLSKEALTEFRSSVLARLPELLQLSSEATLVIMLKHFSKQHKAILSDLAPYPPLLFQYLKQIMNARLGYKSTLSSVRNVTVPSAEDNNMVDSASGDKIPDFSIGNDNLSTLLRRAGLEFSNDMEELYVELLCRFEPTSVLRFLKSFEDYRLEHCLKLCQDYGVADAAAYLLERVGDISSALALVLVNMDYHLHAMDLAVARIYAQQPNVNSEAVNNAEQFLNIPEVVATRSVMHAAIELCQRNTWRMSPGESEALWFRLLDRFVDPLRKLHEARKLSRKRRASRAAGLTLAEKESVDSPYKWKVVMINRKAVDLMQRVLVYLIGEIVNGMMGYIPLSIIMDKLLSNNGKHEFGDFKGTILQMLGLYGYEQTILFTAKQVVEEDTFQKLSIYKRRATRGFAPCSVICCLCKQRLNRSEASNGGNMGPTSNGKEKATAVAGRHSQSTPVMNCVVIFTCGHAAHSSCVIPDIGITKSIPDILSCPCCLPKVSFSKLPTGKRTPHQLL